MPTPTDTPIEPVEAVRKHVDPNGNYVDLSEEQWRALERHWRQSPHLQWWNSIIADLAVRLERAERERDSVRQSQYTERILWAQVVRQHLEASEACETSPSAQTRYQRTLTLNLIKAAGLAALSASENNNG